MRCKTCDYRLWNLATQRCPECGTPFRPSEFEFVPNSVQFQCPHCGQAYYGQAANGHLVPPEFNCVRCGRHVHMDEMLLLPTAGLEEEQTSVRKMPWLDRRQRGFLHGWLGTIGKALVAPLELMRCTPETSSAGAAGWFLILNLFVTLCAAAMPGVLLMSLGVGLGGGAALVGAATGVGFVLLIAFAGTLVLTVVWGLTAHILLRLTGRTAAGLGRTYHALCYSNGANVLTALPCLGWYFGWIWWVISAVLMLKEAQRVHGGRAALAVITFPVLALCSLIGLYAWTILTLIPSAMSVTTMPAMHALQALQETQIVASDLRVYAQQAGGRGPRHALALFDDSSLLASTFISSTTVSRAKRVPVGDRTLDDLFLLPVPEKIALLKSVRASLPADVVAHRLGDFVFVYHGLDWNTADPGLWVVVLSPDPDQNPRPAPTDMITVGKSDDSVFQFPVSQLSWELVRQNALRAVAGLPPLPDPATVTHARPAVPAP